MQKVALRFDQVLLRRGFSLTLGNKTPKLRKPQTILHGLAGTRGLLRSRKPCLLSLAFGRAVGRSVGRLGAVGRGGRSPARVA